MITVEEYLQMLNEQQLKAVTTDSQYVRVVAGAGSGKTRVLTTRIVYMIRSWGIDPRKVLAITFTNKATNEMRSRINVQLGEEAGLVHISTIHSLCVQILRRDIRSLGYPTNFTILDPDDQKSIIREAYKALDIDNKKHNINGILDYIASHKTADLDAEAALDRAYNQHEREKAQIYEYYLHRQKELYALDFDDLLLWAVRLFRTYPEVREKWQRRFQFILVDEFQDIDNVQYDLINLLATDETYIYVVGDPDQTIYTWRGANINIIMNFEKDFRPCETITLERNYRSTQTILGAANSLIRYNKNRLEKNLFTENPEGAKIVHFKAPNEEEEALFAARKILDMNREGMGFNEMAILYRSNYLSRAFEKCLVDFKIPYVIYGGVRFYERQEIKDALSYLRMLVTKDDLSFKRIINTPKRGIGSKTVDYILENARSESVTMYEMAAVIDLPPRARKTIDALIRQIEDWKQRSLDQALEDTLHMILEESGYRQMLEDSDDPKDAERIENLKELISDIHSYQQNTPDATLEDYIQMVALYTDIQMDHSGQFVSLMTVHSAKGLEFRTVFVVGLNDGIFPSEKSMAEGMKGLEEERRLAYVAFTRAKENLFLSENMGYNFNTSTGKVPSRFLSEVDESFIQQAGFRPPVVERKLSSSEELIFSQLSGHRKKPSYRPGDLVVHDDFGEGVIISINGNFGDIAFAYPFKTKTLSLSFPKLHKKENQ
ncbi:MAG: UvrD-helicase domain-containing protein [Erysipelotrichaceae bacterium]|nr:UvrD-helicase domain-containing protein [Erysipelotrichaceae bacterium]